MNGYRREVRDLRSRREAHDAPAAKRSDATRNGCAGTPIRSFAALACGTIMVACLTSCTVEMPSGQRFELGSLKATNKASGARPDLTNFRRVAVMPFTQDPQNQLGNGLESALVSASVNGQPYFTVVSRSDLDQVMREQKVSTSGIVDDKTAAQVGKVLGVNAIVLGTVYDHRCQDKSYQTTTPPLGEALGQALAGAFSKPKSGGTTTYSCVDREAHAQVNVKIIDVSTAAILLSRSLEGREKRTACNQSVAGLEDQSSLARRASERMFQDFVSGILPPSDAAGAR